MGKNYTVEMWRDGTCLSKTCEENRPVLQQWYPGHMGTGVLVGVGGGRGALALGINIGEKRRSSQNVDK